jgi:nucleoside-diphosphate-sugar epimerase
MASAAPANFDPSRPTILLTGATGLIGGAWLPLLQARYPGHQLTVLARNQLDVVRFAAARICVLQGDLTQPDLGLPSHVYRQLACSLRMIVHCAADIRFSTSLAESRAVNLEGTRRLLQLASQSSRFEKFAHLSTVHVVGDRSGEFSECCATPGRFLSAYQQSKFEAEQLVLSMAPHVPSAIYRLSTVIGDSATGHVRQSNYFHQLLRLALANQLPIIPAHKSAPIDLITSDWAVPALHHLFAGHFAAGQILHVCAGPEDSLTAHQLIDLTFDFFDQHPATASLRRGTRPQPVPLSEFSRYAERFLATGAHAKLWRSLSQFLPLLGIPQLFRNYTALGLLGGVDASRPPIQQTLPKVMSYCLESNWGRHSQSQPLLPEALTLG